MLPPPIARVEPPLLDDLIEFINVVCKALAESPAELGAAIVVMELVISLPAPKIKEPLELKVLLATPTTLLAIPDELDAVADSMLFKEPIMVAPKFFPALEEKPPPL